MGFGFPRPQLQRRDWVCLNGPWRFTFDDERRFSHPWEVREWPLAIEVPFAPESEASGLSDTRFHRVCWYQRDAEIARRDDRVLLHFGAVDYCARVWVNDRFATVHEGGYTPSTPTSRTCSIPPAGRRSPCRWRTIRSTSPSRAASRTGSSTRTRSGIRARRASGRRCGSSMCRGPTSASCAGRPR